MIWGRLARKWLALACCPPKYSGRRLIGDEASKGNGPTPALILGGSNAEDHSVTVQTQAHTTIAGFAIHNNFSGAYTIGVEMSGSRVTVKDNRIVDYHLVAIQGAGEESVISGNVIQNNSRGIEFLPYSGTWVRIENNVITGNDLGIMYLGEYVFGDLGGGPGGSAGGNVIAGNTRIDLYVPAYATVAYPPGVSMIYARNNFWDHVPPSVSAVVEDGFDIVNLFGVPIDWTGATLGPTP